MSLNARDSNVCDNAYNDSFITCTEISRCLKTLSIEEFTTFITQCLENIALHDILRRNIMNLLMFQSFNKRRNNIKRYGKKSVNTYLKNKSDKKYKPPKKNEEQYSKLYKHF